MIWICSRAYIPALQNGSIHRLTQRRRSGLLFHKAGFVLGFLWLCSPQRWSLETCQNYCLPRINIMIFETISFKTSLWKDFHIHHFSTQALFFARTGKQCQGTLPKLAPFFQQLKLASQEFFCGCFLCSQVCGRPRHLLLIGLSQAVGDRLWAQMEKTPERRQSRGMSESTWLYVVTDWAPLGLASRAFEVILVARAEINTCLSRSVMSECSDPNCPLVWSSNPPMASSSPQRILALPFKATSSSPNWSPCLGSKNVTNPHTQSRQHYRMLKNLISCTGLQAWDDILPWLPEGWCVPGASSKSPDKHRELDAM